MIHTYVTSTKYRMPLYYDTLKPYDVVEHKGIQYTFCRGYDHVSRCRGLRQLIHNPDHSGRFISLETPNPIQSNANFSYYDVPATEENRLDLIANKFLGSPQYAWVIAYHNGIEDGYTVQEGQRLRIVTNLGQLFKQGEILAPIPALQLSLGME